MLKDTSDIKLSEKQREAVEVINKNNVSIITGGPGTGKTTIIKVIIDMYKSLAKKVVLCAPTGRAAKRMTEATGEDAKTLHRLLEIGKTSDDKVDIDLGVAPIDADVVIVDEMSMVDLFLMNYLLKGIYKGTKLILVGDSDQLPSVGPGSVLKDLIESDKVPCVTLNKIFSKFFFKVCSLCFADIISDNFHHSANTIHKMNVSIFTSFSAKHIDFC
jgi:exodeoxyribonuclease V alpha subunit